MPQTKNKKLKTKKILSKKPIIKTEPEKLSFDDLVMDEKKDENLDELEDKLNVSQTPKDKLATEEELENNEEEETEKEPVEFEEFDEEEITSIKKEKTEEYKPSKSIIDLKADILSVLPKVEEGVKKPQPITPKTVEEDNYLKEHVSLTQEEKSDKEIKIEKQKEDEIHAEVQKESEKIKAEADTIAEVIQIEQKQAVKPPELIEIESILQEGLEEEYKKMDSRLQMEFKTTGEFVALKIMKMLKSIKIIKVLRLIRNWLLLIPQVNKWWLEQECKIKTDKIMQMKREMEEK